MITLYDKIMLVLQRLTGQDDEVAHEIAVDKILELIEERVKEEREAAADDKLWDYQCQQQKDLLWKSRTTGVPDLFFSPELQGYWDNGTPGNI